MDTTCIVNFFVRKDLEQTIVADSFMVVANYQRINKLDSTILLSLEKGPPEAMDVRIALPQVRIKYND